MSEIANGSYTKPIILRLTYNKNSHAIGQEV